MIGEPLSHDRRTPERGSRLSGGTKRHADATSGISTRAGLGEIRDAQLRRYGSGVGEIVTATHAGLIRAPPADDPEQEQDDSDDGNHPPDPRRSGSSLHLISAMIAPHRSRCAAIPHRPGGLYTRHLFSCPHVPRPVRRPFIDQELGYGADRTGVVSCDPSRGRPDPRTATAVPRTAVRGRIEAPTCIAIRLSQRDGSQHVVDVTTGSDRRRWDDVLCSNNVRSPPRAAIVQRTGLNLGRALP